MDKRHDRRLIVFLAVLSLITACASATSYRGEFFHAPSGVNLQWPPAPQTPRILYSGSFKAAGTKKGSGSWLKKAVDALFGAEKSVPLLVRPYGIYADAQKLYATDPGSGTVHVFDRVRNRHVQVEKADEFDIISPIGVTADSTGHIFVSDSVLKRIFVFASDGQLLRAIGQEEIFQRPAGIALSEEKLYVVDALAHRVLVLSKTDGRLLFTFGAKGSNPGEFNYPTHIFIARDGRIFVTDSLNFRVQIFSRDGRFMSSFGKPGDGSGNFSKPKGVAVDSEGHIYVVDAHFDNVQIFDETGQLLLAFGSPGNGDGEFTLPAGIFIDPSNKIYVADSYNGRIQVFQYLAGSDRKIAK